MDDLLSGLMLKISDSRRTLSPILFQYPFTTIFSLKELEPNRGMFNVVKRNEDAEAILRFVTPN